MRSKVSAGNVDLSIDHQRSIFYFRLIGFFPYGLPFSCLMDDIMSVLPKGSYRTCCALSCLVVIVILLIITYRWIGLS